MPSAADIALCEQCLWNPFSCISLRVIMFLYSRYIIIYIIGPQDRRHVMFMARNNVTYDIEQIETEM